MATDYDALRKSEDGLNEDSIEELKASQLTKEKQRLDIDERDESEQVELPGADLSNEELSVQVVPKQADEFTCTNCFLVRHRSQLSDVFRDPPVCRECAAGLSGKSASMSKKVRSTPKVDGAPARR